MNAFTRPMPLAADLIDRALRNPDLIADLQDVFKRDSRLFITLKIANQSLEIALDDWCFDNRQPVAFLPDDYRSTLVLQLIATAEREIAQLEQSEADTIADAMAAGDIDRHGRFLPYDKYYGGL